MQYSHFGSQVSKIIWTLVLATVVVGFLLMTVFEPFQKSADGGPIEIRSYQVSAAYADEVEHNLSSALASLDGTKRIGTVNYAANGTLLVTAPSRIQKSVEAIIADITAARPAATPSIILEAWVVRSADASMASAALNEINEALQVVKASQGISGFELVEKLKLTTRSGFRGSIEGQAILFNAEPTLRLQANNEERIASSLSIMFKDGGQIATETEIKPGQFLVLAQANHDFGGSVRVQPVFYIVRGTVVTSDQS